MRLRNQRYGEYPVTLTRLNRLTGLIKLSRYLIVRFEILFCALCLVRK